MDSNRCLLEESRLKVSAEVEHYRGCFPSEQYCISSSNVEYNGRSIKPYVMVHFITIFWAVQIKLTDHAKILFLSRVRSSCKSCAICILLTVTSRNSLFERASYISKNPRNAPWYVIDLLLPSEWRHLAQVTLHCMHGACTVGIDRFSALSLPHTGTQLSCDVTHV